HVVQSGGFKSRIYEWDGNAWELLLELPWWGAVISESTDGLVVLDRYGIGYRESEGWTREQVAPQVPYECVALNSRGEIAVGSSSGVVSIHDGSRWRDIPIDGAPSVFDIEYFDDSTLLVALEEGRLGWYEDGAWRFDDLGGPRHASLSSLWCDGEGGAFVANYEGVVFRYSGDTWVSEDASMIQQIWGWSTDSGPKLVGAGYDLGVRDNNGIWTTLDVHRDTAFEGVSGSGPNDAIAYGYGIAWTYGVDGWSITDPPLVSWHAVAGGLAGGAFGIEESSRIVYSRNGATETLLDSPDLILTGIDMRKTEFGPDVVAVGSPGIVY
ncbi:MAG: hypothetical protein KDA27_28715, partial [Candidatus Eisenbacteria bacterium]|nr:hypothetical protein [Candidatus Eisenbacteria bacterium]